MHTRRHHDGDCQMSCQIARHAPGQLVVLMTHERVDRGCGAPSPRPRMACTRDRNRDRADVRDVASEEIYAHSAHGKQGAPPDSMAPRSRREGHAHTIGRSDKRARGASRDRTRCRGSFGAFRPSTTPARLRLQRRRGHGALDGGICVPVHSRTSSCGIPRRSKIRPTV
jgi:hypothetical protein